MNDEIKIRILITKGQMILHEQHGSVDGGRHEFQFAQPLRLGDGGKTLQGLAVECWLGDAHHVVYEKALSERPIDILIPR